MPLWLIAAWTRAKSIRPSTWGWIVAIIAALAFMSTCTVLGVKADREKDRITRQMNKDRGIREEVGNVRADDKERIDNSTEKLNDAVASLPDSLPSNRRIALACQRLRNDGHERLPAACGPEAK